MSSYPREEPVTSNASSFTLAPQSNLVVVDPAFMDRITALRQTLAPTLTDTELELFALVAQRKGLDPFSGQIMAVKRNSKGGPRVTYQTGIDGYRSLAARTDQYLGSDDAEYGEDCPCGKAPAGHPLWARVVVRRWHPPSGQVIPQPGRADWHEFVPSDDFMWREKPRLMLAKCAEAQALRKAFPWVLGDLYIPEEMARADETPSTPPTVTARAAVAAKAAELRGDNDEGGQEDDDGSAGAGVLADPPPDAPEGTVSLTPEQFRERVAAVGIMGSKVVDAAAELFPGRLAGDLSPEDLGTLWDRLTAVQAADG